MSKRPVFITGGTGYVGQRLAAALLARGHRVRVLSRPQSVTRIAPGAQAVIGDALDAASYAAALTKDDTLVHLVGTPHPSPAKAGRHSAKARRRQPDREDNDRVYRCLAFIIVVLTTAHAAAGQTSARAGQSARELRPAGETYKPPRTAWGDPDLQGTYSNSNEYATPLERPARFDGRRLEDITPAEMAQIRQAAEQQAVDGLAPGPRGPDYWWLENLNLSKRAQAWSVVDPPDGRIPPLTPDARKRGAGPARTSFMGGPFNGPEDLGFLERCITRSVPGSMIPVMYGNNYQIVQTPGFVVITYEIIHETRVIPIDGRPHVGSGLRMHMGDPRGHWEGDTLVVETTNFTKAAAYRGADPATFRVVERFKRVAADTIQWTATMEDPATWTRPWTIAMPLVLDTQSPILPFECHEHNYGMFNILKAARAAEKKP